MRIIPNTIIDDQEPQISNGWLKRKPNGELELLYFINGKWQPVSAGSSGESAKKDLSNVSNEYFQYKASLSGVTLHKNSPSIWRVSSTNDAGLILDNTFPQNSFDYDFDCSTDTTNILFTINITEEVELNPITNCSLTIHLFAVPNTNIHFKGNLGLKSNTMGRISLGGFSNYKYTPSKYVSKIDIPIETFGYLDRTLVLKNGDKLELFLSVNQEVGQSRMRIESSKKNPTTLNFNLNTTAASLIDYYDSNDLVVPLQQKIEALTSNILSNSSDATWTGAYAGMHKLYKSVILMNALHTNTIHEKDITNLNIGYIYSVSAMHFYSSGVTSLPHIYSLTTPIKVMEYFVELNKAVVKTPMNNELTANDQVLITVLYTTNN